MIVPPNKAIGVIGCACIVTFTLIVLLKFNSDTWTTTPSVRHSMPIAQQTSPDFFGRDQYSVPSRLESNVDRGRALNPQAALGDVNSSGMPRSNSSPKVVDDQVQLATYNDGFGYPNEPGIVERLSSKDLATLQSLPMACTTELPAYLDRQPQNGRMDSSGRALADGEIVANLNGGIPAASASPLTGGRRLPSRAQADVVAYGYPLNEEQPVADVALADETLYNPHAKATQTAFSSAGSQTKSTDSDDDEGEDNEGEGEGEGKGKGEGSEGSEGKDKKDPHFEIYSRDAFPSARECKTCHEQIFDEWASSSHAYASISPMFHVFEEKINKLTSGTIGYFCLRCHAPVATTMGLRRDQPIWDGPAVFREGVTCVACHRVKTPYTKTDGERRIEPGDIYAPVYGGSDGQGVAIAAKYPDNFKVKTDPHDKGVGQPMHRRSIKFEELSKSTFCASCHQVAVKPGIKLEVVWDQYRASPACKEGVSCQDCHMGIVPGVDAGYSFGPAAVVNGKVVNAERKHSNHIFYGPGYSIAHPGVFPQTTEADKWTFTEWLAFDWRSDWGKEKFEDDVADGLAGGYFPPEWQDADERIEAREIVTKNLKKLVYKKDLRRQLLENGSKLDGPFFADKPTAGRRLNFRYCLTNTNPGHNMPSGSLGAQPQLWMNAVLIDPDGNRIWETGYVDSNGDLADNHSLDVLARLIPLDDQLFNLQSKFLTTNVKGTEREMYLPINFDVDQLPFIRPAQQPVTVINHPPGIRLEGHSIPALGSRNAKFSIPGDLIRRPGAYRLSVRMRSRAEPIYFMRFSNATPEMERMMNEWIVDFHVKTVAFEVR